MQLLYDIQKVIKGKITTYVKKNKNYGYYFLSTNINTICK